MTIVKEVVDAMKLLSDGIKTMETFVSACKNGQKFLQTRYPDVSQDISVMCSEIRKTLLAMAAASSVVTNFRFTVVGGAMDTEPRRFNEAFIAHKPQEVTLRQQIDSSRGHCTKIGDRARELEEKANSLGFSSVFRFIGIKSKEREKELSAALQEIYDHDKMFHTVVSQMTIAVTATFKVIQEQLGPPGTMDPANVSRAAHVLGEHAQKFEVLEKQCNDLADELQKIIEGLNPLGR